MINFDIKGLDDLMSGITNKRARRQKIEGNLMINFDIKGLDDLMSGITKLSKIDNQNVNEALKESASSLADEMIENAPVRTGKGRDSIKVGNVRTRKGLKHITVGIHVADHSTGLHMYYQEYGTSMHPPNPFMRNSFNNQKDEIYKRIAFAYRQGLAKIK